MAFVKSLGDILVADGFQLRNGARIFDGTGFPQSGAGGTGLRDEQGAPKGSFYVDAATGTVFQNEGTKFVPYWTPVSFDQRGLFGAYEDFRGGVQLAGVSATTATVTLASGLRVHGEGIAEVDSGLAVATTDQGHVGTFSTTDEALHTIQVGFGSGTVSTMKPNVNGTMVIDAFISQSSANTERHFFFGFSTAPADNNAPILVGGTTTITIGNTIGDDFAGLYFSSALTASGTWHAPYDKANTNATLTSTSFLTTGSVAVAAAGTYQRLRVEVDTDGAFRMFINKAEVATGAAGSLTAGTAITPTIQLGVPTAITAVKSFLAKQIAIWGAKS